MEMKSSPKGVEKVLLFGVCMKRIEFVHLIQSQITSICWGFIQTRHDFYWSRKIAQLHEIYVYQRKRFITH